MFFSSATLIALFGLAGDGSTPWWNYPGLELWKFFNLFVFIVIARMLLGKPLREALRARGETIKRELAKAREERDLALAKLTEVEARFARLDEEVAAIKAKAAEEAEAERERLRLGTEKEIVRIREQAKRELESVTKAAKHELRRFTAQESVRLAEAILIQEIKPEDDARLASLNVQELGRVEA